MEEIVINDQIYLVDHIDPEQRTITILKTEPGRNTIITKLAFKRRFTMTELALFVTLTKEDVNAEVFLDLINCAEDVTLDDALLINGMDYLVSANILTEARKVEILT
jgi:hypothetical protein